MPVAGRVWSADAVRRHKHTSPYGSVVALAESPLAEGLLYAGTDDGLIQVSEDGGGNWRRIEKIRGVPELAMVEDILPSRHDAAVAYAVFDNHKSGDYRPYVMKTTDRGRSWASVAGNLPERGIAHAIEEDHVNPGLLFVGTHFGLFFSQDGGGSWNALREGFPTISVRDLEIQRREGDLVVGTFGRGIYILDDYSALRTPAAKLRESEATLFPIRETWRYIVGDRWGPYFGGSYGEEGKDVQGADFFNRPNPPFGAMITYYLKDGLKTKRDIRRERERPLNRARKDVPQPSWEALRAEDREEEPAILFTIRDGEGRIVRRLHGPTGQGLHRIAWDLKGPSLMPVRLGPPGPIYPWQTDPEGPLAPPGTYTVTLEKRSDGVLTRLAGPQEFIVKPANLSAEEEADDQKAVFEFQLQTSELYRASSGAARAARAIDERIAHLEAALLEAPDTDETHHETLRGIKSALYDIEFALFGDRTKASRQSRTPMTVGQWVNAAKGHWGSLSGPTGTQREAHRIAKAQLERILADLRAVDSDLEALEQAVDRAGAPWTPGRVPSLRIPQ